MATVDFNVQFWAPPSNPFPHKQRSALSHSTSKSTYTTSSRNPPAPLHNQAARIFKQNNQSTSAIAAARHQGDDSVARAQGRNNNPTNRDDETDDDFPLIKELLSQISHEGISTRGCQDPKDTLQHLEEPALDTSRSRPSPTQSRLDNGIDGSQGTRDKPVILEDDNTPTPNPEATTEPSKPTDPSSHGRWCDIKDGGYVDDNFRPIPSLEQEGLASTTTPAQGQPHPLHHSLRLSQDQINQHSNDGTIRRTSEEPGPYSLSTPLDENGGGGSEEKTVSELEKDLLLAFEEQEKPSLAPAPSSPHRPSAEQLHPQIDWEHDQEHDQSGRLEELKHSTPLRSQDQEEEPEEQQQQQEVVIEAIREEEDDGDNKEREPQGEKHQRQGNEEVSRDNHHPNGGDCNHNTSDEDDEDPRPAKRQKLLPTPTDNALTPPNEPTPVDNDHHHTPRTSRSPSITVESALVAEYQEWPFQGFLKRTRIGNETTYNLEFQLSHVPEHLHLPVLSEALGMRSNKETSAEPATPHNIVAHSKVRPATLQSKRKRVPWEPEENETILKMKKEGCSWEKIHAALPHRTTGAIQVQYSTKLKK